MSRKKNTRKSSARITNRFRIIAGKYRGRWVNFPDAQGLRPTPDRVRETVFNWLQGDLWEAKVLDAFAGSGALAFEALSRGAKSAILIEKQSLVYRQLQQSISDLSMQQRAIARNEDVVMFLESTAERFDLIFLDPPYRKQLLQPCLALIRSKSLLTLNGFVYAEHESDAVVDIEALGYEVYRQMKAGQVTSLLLRLKDREQ